MEHLNWGLQMTVLGMGLVFGLLALLWAFLTLMGAIDKEPAPAAAKEETSEAERMASIVEAERIASVADDKVGAQAPALRTVNGMPADLVAAIVTATYAHRVTLRRQASPLMRSYLPGSKLFASRWVAVGRARQNYNWQPKGK